MNKAWERADYIEEDVRRHSEEIRALTQIVTENASAIRSLIKELERGQAPFEDHEKRVRILEMWKSRSMVYWGITITVVGTMASTVVPELLPLVNNTQQLIPAVEHYGLGNRPK